MTYEERVTRIRELAGDYNKIVNDFNLERALYNSVRSKFRESIQQLLEPLSLGDIKVSINDGGYLIATRDNWETTECLYKFSFFSSEYLHGDTERILKSVLEESLLRIAARMSTSGIYRIGDVAKFSSYASLVAVSADKDVAEAIRKIASEYTEVERSFSKKNNQYANWVSSISPELYLLACSWFEEKAVLTPGMKIGIINRKTQEVAIGTIKRVKKTEKSLSITLNESASIITDPDRIHTGLTWYLNNGECSEIAKAIKWRPIADFI